MSEAQKAKAREELAQRTVDSNNRVMFRCCTRDGVGNNNTQHAVMHSN